MNNIFLETVAFLISVAACFYLPGKLFVTRLKINLPGIAGIFLSIVTGITTFTLALYILSWIHLQFLVIPLVFILAGYMIKKRLWKQPLSKKEVAPFVFIAFCAFIFSLTLLLYGIHGTTIVYQYDDLWHIALMQELKVHFPPGIPISAGVPLQGYHFFFDFLQANISNLFFLSPFNVHFYFFSSLIALLWGMGVYTLMITWTKKIAAGLWAVFLTMFGGSFAYILHFQGHTEVSLKEGLKMLQPSTVLYNPPLASSIVILLFCLTLLYQYLKTRNKNWMIPFILAAGILPMFKVYAGIILYGGVAILVLYEMIKRRFFLLKIAIATGIVSLLTFGVFLGSGGGFIWYPFWPPHELLRDFAWYGYDEKITTYMQQGVIRGIVETELYGFSLFLFANLGTRIFGILGLLFLIKKAKPSLFSGVLIVMLLISILFPLLLIQTGKVFEIIQMTNYYLFFCSLFAAYGFTVLFSKRYKFWTIGTTAGIILVVILTLPSTIFSLNATAAGVSHPQSLSNPYHQTLFSLREKGSFDDTILIIPLQKDTATMKQLIRWQLDASPEISALTNKQVYLAGTGIRYNGMDIENRLQKISEVVQYINKPTDQGALATEKFLTENHIKYIFVPYNAKALLKVKGVNQLSGNTYYLYEVTN